MLRCATFSLLLVVWAVSGRAWADGGSEVGNGQYTRLGSVSSERASWQLEAKPNMNVNLLPSATCVLQCQTHTAIIIVLTKLRCLQCNVIRGTSPFCMSGKYCCLRCTMHLHISLTLGAMHTYPPAYTSKHSRNTFIVPLGEAHLLTYGNSYISFIPLCPSLTMSPHPSSCTLPDKEHFLPAPCSITVEHAFHTAAGKSYMPSYHWNPSVKTSKAHHVVNRHRVYHHGTRTDGRTTNKSGLSPRAGKIGTAIGEALRFYQP